MPEASSSLRCAACRWPLGSDDLFCPRCGAPTPKNVDPEATLVNPGVGSGDGAAAATGTEPDTVVTADAGVEAPAAPLSVTEFTDRLRDVLGTEYELLASIGQGGFARVYRAKDRRLDRLVAIKVIRPDLMGNKLFVDSFRNEGIALAKLRHPGIVPIYDIRQRGGLIYYIMPFVQGTTLETRMKRARLPPFETRRVLIELADALGAAHRAQMVHLDIKPANVFLEGDLQKVLLMDFGTAKTLTVQAADPSGAGSAVVGTPEYMSPEQAKGLEEIDHRSDIYSLGVLGYRMLAGRPPFTGRTANEILAKHQNEAPRPLREVNPSIPKDFADIIMRCLNKNPWERFTTTNELRGALETVTFFSGREQSAAEASAGMQRTLVILIASVALLVGLLLGRVLH